MRDALVVMVVVMVVGAVRDAVFVSGFVGEGCRAGGSGQLRWIGGGGWADHCGWSWRSAAGDGWDLVGTEGMFMVSRSWLSLMMVLLTSILIIGIPSHAMD